MTQSIYQHICLSQKRKCKFYYTLCINKFHTKSVKNNNKVQPKCTCTYFRKHWEISRYCCPCQRDLWQNMYNGLRLRPAVLWWLMKAWRECHPNNDRHFPAISKMAPLLLPLESRLHETFSTGGDTVGTVQLNVTFWFLRMWYEVSETVTLGRSTSIVVIACISWQGEITLHVHNHLNNYFCIF